MVSPKSLRTTGTTGGLSDGRLDIRGVVEGNVRDLETDVFRPSVTLREMHPRPWGPVTDGTTTDRHTGASTGRDRCS